jgi:ubiquinone/menaquinone biosynthesis C-methylase UbiE
MEMSFADPLYNAASIGVRPGDVIADFGAGSGHYTLQFGSLLAGSGVVYAIDVQHDLLLCVQNEAVRHGLLNILTVHGDIERLGGTRLPDAHVDLALISNTLFQLARPEQALAEARRILKPRASLAIIDWSDSFGGLGPAREHVVPKELALDLAFRGGFDLVSEFPAGAHHYGLVFAAPQGRA